MKLNKKGLIIRLLVGSIPVWIYAIGLFIGIKYETDIPAFVYAFILLAVVIFCLIMLFVICWILLQMFLGIVDIVQMIIHWIIEG
jgi:hypothetical protein